MKEAQAAKRPLLNEYADQYWLEFYYRSQDYLTKTFNSRDRQHREFDENGILITGGFLE